MPQPLIRILNHGGERWLNLEELKRLILTRDDLMGQALAMLRIGYDRKETPQNSMKAAIGSVLQFACGENETPEIIPVIVKPRPS